MTAGMVLGSAYCFTISALHGPFDGVATMNCVLGQPQNCLDQLFDTHRVAYQSFPEGMI